MPDSVNEIGEGAFRGNHLLKEVIISEGVKIIGESAFEYCSQLEIVRVPKSIEEIKNFEKLEN